MYIITVEALGADGPTDRRLAEGDSMALCQRVDTAALAICQAPAVGLPSVLLEALLRRADKGAGVRLEAALLAIRKDWQARNRHFDSGR